jgi:hypothetical protein
MQSVRTQTSLYEGQPGMNVPWGFQAHLKWNNLAMLPVMNPPAFNFVSCPCPSMNTPQFLPSRSPANVFKSSLKAQARIQAQQIDSAIQLLKMQYDAVMASVQNSHNQTLEQPNFPLSSTAAAPSQVVDQKSFAMRFELPDPESDKQCSAASVMETASSKRKIRYDFHGVSITSLADFASYSPIKNSECSVPSKKRTRRQ